MNIEKAIEIYNHFSNDEKIRKFDDARHLIIEEMNKRKPELEFYKSSKKYDYYIEKPYEDLEFSNNQVIKTQHSYDAIGKGKKSTVSFCRSLCRYSREEIIKVIEEHIVQDNLEEENQC